MSKNFDKLCLFIYKKISIQYHSWTQRKIGFEDTKVSQPHYCRDLRKITDYSNCLSREPLPFPL